MQLLPAFALFLLGLALLVKGADVFVAAASEVAGRLGVSKIIIGLTIVAFGTSAPELAVNLSAMRSGNSSLAIGNVVGSNIANLGLILGIAALGGRIAVKSTILNREMPFLFLTSIALVIALVDHRLAGGCNRPILSQGEGLTFLLFFSIYLYYLFAGAIREHRQSRRKKQSTQLQEGGRPRRPWVLGLMLVGGLALIIGGGELTVRQGSQLALAMGMSEAFVGLILVAVGTSLPEVATALTATRRGESDLILGNVIGSNIFNTVAVLGVSASLAPLPYDPVLMRDVAVMLFFSLAAFAATYQGRSVDRWEGGCLLAGYLVYVGYATLR